MTARISRGLLVALLCASLSGLPALAADASLVGQVTVTEGAIDPSWRIQVTPLTGGDPVHASIVSGRYEVGDIPEGPYKIAVVDATGEPVGEVLELGLVAGLNTVDMMVGPSVVPPPPPPAKEETEDEKKKKKNYTVWYVVGGVVGAALIALAVQDDEDDPSPSAP